jgi:hypothetical protein
VQVTGIDDDARGVAVRLVRQLRLVSRISPDGRRVGEAPVGDDGTAEFDLGGFDPGFWSLSVEVDHPHYRQEIARVQVTDEGGRELAAHIALTRACVLTGVVQDAQGAPIPNAVVTLAPGPYEVEYDVESAGDGRFRYRSLPGERVHLVAGASGFRTSSLVVTAPLTHEAQVPPIVLDRGAAIRGRVTGHSRGHGTETIVRAAWYGGGESLDHREHPWGGVYAEDRFVRDRVTARVDAEGDYLLEGLEPGPWRLRVVDVVADLDVTVGSAAQEILDAADRLVSAPRDGVSFDVSRATLLVRVCDADGPIAGTSVGFGTADGTIVWTDCDGMAALAFPALRATEIRSPAYGTTPIRRSVRAESDGTVGTIVEVTSSRAEIADRRPSESNGALLTVRAVGPDDREVSARCRVYAADGTRLPVAFEGRRGNATYTSAERLLPGGPSSVVLPTGVPLVFEFDADGYATRREPLRIDPDDLIAPVLRVLLSPR